MDVHNIFLPVEIISLIVEYIPPWYYRDLMRTARVFSPIIDRIVGKKVDKFIQTFFSSGMKLYKIFTYSRVFAGNTNIDMEYLRCYVPIFSDNILAEEWTKRVKVLYTIPTFPFAENKEKMLMKNLLQESNNILDILILNKD